MVCICVCPIHGFETRGDSNMKRSEIFRRNIGICEKPRDPCYFVRLTYFVLGLKLFHYPVKPPATTLYLGPKLWNRPPNKLRLVTSINVFKTNVRKMNVETLLDERCRSCNVSNN